MEGGATVASVTGPSHDRGRCDEAYRAGLSRGGSPIDLYPLGAALFGGALRALGVQMRSFGHEHLPRTDPAVLASNHIGYLDFSFIALAPPRPRRRIRFVARRDLFTHRIAGPLMRGLGHVEADPYGDPHATVHDAVGLLRAGEVIGIHPEGTISPSFEPRAGRTGAVRMARDADAPVVPVAVWGSQRLVTKWRPRNLRERGITVDVHYGEPYHPAGDPVAATEEPMARIRALLEHAWDTYPQRPITGRGLVGARLPRWDRAHARGGGGPDPGAARAPPTGAPRRGLLTGSPGPRRGSSLGEGPP
jgi:1-acyl-sn-glycerol-3-phosphate acyltransferase